MGGKTGTENRDCLNGFENLQAFLANLRYYGIEL